MKFCVGFCYLFLDHSEKFSVNALKFDGVPSCDFTSIDLSEREECSLSATCLQAEQLKKISGVFGVGSVSIIIELAGEEDVDQFGEFSVGSELRDFEDVIEGIEKLEMEDGFVFFGV